jgi:Arc/MetJ family transcription regulator
MMVVGVLKYVAAESHPVPRCGILFFVYLESMKTTIDIPDEALADAMRFTGAKTKREAVVKALEAFNRSQRVQDLVASFGTLDFASNDEIEAGDLEEIALREAGGRKP